MAQPVLAFNTHIYISAIFDFDMNWPARINLGSFEYCVGVLGGLDNRGIKGVRSFLYKTHLPP